MAKKIILDTSALLICFPRRSPFRPIFDAFLDGKFDLLISNEIVSEYVEKVEEKASATVAQNVGELLTNARNAIKQDIWFNFNMMTNDPDDNKFVDCAIAGNADLIVSNDRHFRILKNQYPPVKVISVDDFLEMILKNKL